MAKKDDLQRVIRSTVKATVDELKRSGMLKSSNDAIYKSVSDRLISYYKTPNRDKKMVAALSQLEGDYYFGILEMFFGSRYTVEYIAGKFGCEASTISRNKRRLCLTLHSLLGG